MFGLHLPMKFGNAREEIRFSFLHMPRVNHCDNNSNWVRCAIIGMEYVSVGLDSKAIVFVFPLTFSPITPPCFLVICISRLILLLGGETIRIQMSS
jgi:hypothetical protein